MNSLARRAAPSQSQPARCQQVARNGNANSVALVGSMRLAGAYSDVGGMQPVRAKTGQSPQGVCMRYGVRQLKGSAVQLGAIDGPNVAVFNSGPRKGSPGGTAAWKDTRGERGPRTHCSGPERVKGCLDHQFDLCHSRRYAAETLGSRYQARPVPPLNSQFQPAGMPLRTWRLYSVRHSLLTLPRCLRVAGLSFGAGS